MHSIHVRLNDPAGSARTIGALFTRQIDLASGRMQHRNGGGDCSPAMGDARFSVARTAPYGTGWIFSLIRELGMRDICAEKHAALDLASRSGEACTPAARPARALNRE